ncbi:MAG TPA: hypothetical protein VGQ52_12330 [Gemmatimonadaceae bacterium]|nr:hypothetical protein [Gemmatimonadaceae bacterium]
MFRARRLITAAAFASTTLAATVQAQTASASAFSNKRTSATVQRRTGGSPSLTLYGGLATGDNGFDLGPALAASFNWRIADAPFNVRLDPYFAYHSSDEGPDASLWFLGATGNLELAFRPSGTTAEPYIFGGGGFYFRSISIEGIGGDEDFDDSDLKGAFDFGGGVRFGGFTLEAKLQDIDEFTNVSFLVGFRLGG